jgi:hypothetical protein
MPRAATPTTLDALVEDAVDELVRRTSLAIARTIADLTVERLEAELRATVAKAAAGGVRTRRRRPAAALSRWAADRRARRVPKFVIELTGLETKREIVARYGDGVVFEKGKPAPKPNA